MYKNLQRDIPRGIRVVNAKNIMPLVWAKLTNSLARVRDKLPIIRLILTPALSMRYPVNRSPYRKVRHAVSE